MSLNQQNSTQTIASIRPWLYKPKKSRFGTRKNFKYNGKQWTRQEISKYIQFITLYMDLFKRNSTQKRRLHLNRILSKYIGTRSPVQCRSHHQRMIKIYGSLENILKEASQPVSLHRQENVKKHENSMQHIKSTQFLMLPDFSLQPLFVKQEEPNQVSLHQLDSNEIILPQGNDLCEL